MFLIVGRYCLIGQMDDMDPLIPVYLYRKFGEKAVRAFVENINCCAAPIGTIRHIGKAGNTYGSVFVMPYLFAQICTGKSIRPGTDPSRWRSGGKLYFVLYKRSLPAGLHQKHIKPGTHAQSFLKKSIFRSVIPRC